MLFNETIFQLPPWGIEGAETQRQEVFLFHAKLAKEQGRKGFETQRHEGAKARSFL